MTPLRPSPAAPGPTRGLSPHHKAPGPNMAPGAPSMPPRHTLRDHPPHTAHLGAHPSPHLPPAPGPTRGLSRRQDAPGKARKNPERRP